MHLRVLGRVGLANVYKMCTIWRDVGVQEMMCIFTIGGLGANMGAIQLETCLLVSSGQGSALGVITAASVLGLFGHLFTLGA